MRTYEILLVGIVLLCQVGCGKNTIPEAGFRLTPDILDFGKVRALDSPVTLPFEIENNGGKSLTVRAITSGCGCTVVEIPNKPIPPGQKAIVYAKVNILGRFGEFRNVIRVKTASHPDSSLEIRGYVVTDIWYDGQSIRCTAEPGQRQASTVFSLRTIDYPDVLFENGCRDDGITLSEIRRDRLHAETSIQFRLEVDIGDSESVMRSIHITPKNAEIAPLIIPFHCYRGSN